MFVLIISFSLVLSECCWFQSWNFLGLICLRDHGIFDYDKKSWVEALVTTPQPPYITRRDGSSLKILSCYVGSSYSMAILDI